jgi:transcriptional regulator with XRE-family HTH domain
VSVRRIPLPAHIIERRRLLGLRIAQLRRAAGLSQDQLAERAGLERRSIQRYESGERDPRFTDLVLLAEGIGATVEDLVCE